MKKITSLLGIAALIFFASSCKKDDTSANANLNISAKLKSSSFAVNKTLASSAAANLIFDAGYIWVGEIVFDGDIVGGQSVSRTIEGFSKIDFVTGIANPIYNDVIIPAGDYTSVNLGVELRDEDAQPAIWLTGMYTRSDGTTSPIDFRFNSGEVFEATAASATVSGGKDMLAYIVLDPSVWFSVISASTLDNAVVNSNGVIMISSSSNAAIFDDVADRLDVSTEGSFQ